MFKCKKCGILKYTEKSKCACNIKKFNEDKLSKKTRKETKQKAIPHKSEKKIEADKQRGKLDLVFKKIAKKKCDTKGNAVCEYCKADFNIIFDFINQAVAFAHILSRGDVLYVHLAMFINNIAFVCSEKCHKDMDAEICVLGIKKVLQKEIENGKTIDVSDLQKYVSY